jgi:hypothetical protein
LITFDVQVLMLLLEIIICMPIFLVASYLLLKLVNLISSRLALLLCYLAFPGVVLHEVCHDIMCRATGIPVLGHHIIIRRGVRGGVELETSRIQSFTNGLLICLAPLFILSLALYFLIAFWAIAPMHEILKLYFAYCFFIGLSPSKADLNVLSSIARRMPGQTLMELGLIFLPLLFVFGYLLFCTIASSPFSLWLFVVTFAMGSLVAYLLWREYQPHRNP